MARMTTFFALVLMAWANWLAGCTTATNNPTGNFGHTPLLYLKHPRSAPSSQALLHQFAAAHARADSVVMMALPDAQDWASLTTTYGFTYPYWEANLADTLPGPALEYKFYYGLLHQGDTVQSAIVSIGPDLRIRPSELAELAAYKKFLQGELAIGRQKAIAIAKRHGLKEPGAVVTFHSGNVPLIDTLSSLQPVSAYYNDLTIHPVLFYWELQNDCDGCAWLQVGAGNGKLLQKGQTQVVY
jgi:hypothetical protein